MTTSIGKKLRMSKIFHKDGRALILAYDHRMGGNRGPGLTDPGKIIDAIIEGGADAMMTTIGIIRQYNDKMAAGKLGVIIRTDCVRSRYTPKQQQATAWPKLVSIRTAVKLGCDAVINMVVLGSSTELKALEFAAHVSNECEKWGMPWVAEIIPGPLKADSEVIGACCQVAEEYGADFVKTHWTGSADSFKDAISTVKIPILLAGGAPTDTPKKFLEQVEEAIQAGARGLFCGRNIFTYEEPHKMTCALRKIIHEGASAKEAEKVL